MRKCGDSCFLSLKTKKYPTKECSTHNNRDGVGSGEDLFDQAIPVIQRLHHLPLIFGNLQRKKRDTHESCNKCSTLEFTCLWSPSVCGAWRNLYGDDRSINPETPVHHCITCAWCLLKLCGLSCKGAVSHRWFKWPIRDQVSTAQNDLRRQQSVLAVTSATVSTRWAFPSLFLWPALNSCVHDLWKEKAAALTGCCNVRRLPLSTVNYRFHNSWLSGFAIPPNFLYSQQFFLFLAS